MEKLNIEIIEKAIKSYEKLQEIVNSHNGTLEELCDKLNGHNLEDELFDVNFEWICATILNKNNKLILSYSIEIWNDTTYEFLGTHNIEHIKLLMNNEVKVND